MFLRGEDPIDKSGRDLPHWQQGEVMQFVTFRLADAMPERKLAIWREERDVWLDLHPKPWSPEKSAEYNERFTEQLEFWLDQGHGSCVLKGREYREALEEVLMHFQGDRVEHESWVIMPNHVHLLFTPRAPLDDLLKAWKGVSSKKIGLGPIWQKNYRDRLIRDLDHYRSAVRYIRKNPKGLPENSYTLWESSRARAVTTVPS